MTSVTNLQAQVNALTVSANTVKEYLLLTQTALAVAGDYKYSARNSDFNGWVLCDGRNLACAEYVALYQVIGNAFGGDSNNFKLPDFRGRVPGVIGAGVGLTARSMGQVVGAETHTLTTPELPSHTHTTNAVGGTVGLITANGANTAVTVDSSSVEPNLYAAPVALTVNNTGSGSAHNNMQPTLFAGNMFIYTGILNNEA